MQTITVTLTKHEAELLVKLLDVKELDTSHMTLASKIRSELIKLPGGSTLKL